VGRMSRLETGASMRPARRPGLAIISGTRTDPSEAHLNQRRARRACRHDPGRMMLSSARVRSSTEIVRRPCRRYRRCWRGSHVASGGHLSSDVELASWHGGAVGSGSCCS
jgi:hypothetical protein